METKDIQGSVKDYLTLRQTARATGVKEPTLRRWIRAGIVDGFKNATGSLYYFHKDQLDKIRKLAIPNKIVSEEELPENPFEDIPPLPYDVETGEVITTIKVDEVNVSPEGTPFSGKQVTIKEPNTLAQELLGLSDDAKVFLGERMIEALCDLIK